MKTLILIPSRLSATRLPGKPLLKINGLSIISHVVRKAQQANIGEVIVAAEDQEIIDDVENNGGKAILTSNEHKTGTDRIYEAFSKLKLNDIDLVMNLQGDEPLMNIEDIINLNFQMIKNKSEFGTLASIILDKKFCDNINIVKVETHKFDEGAEKNSAENVFSIKKLEIGLKILRSEIFSVDFCLIYFDFVRFFLAC